MDPKRVVSLGPAKLGRFLQKRHRTDLLPDLVDAIIDACQSAATLYENIQHMPLEKDTLQDEMTWEREMLEHEQTRIKHLEKQINEIYAGIDPHQVLASLPGIADILAASIFSCTGDIDRFPSVCKHRGFAGFYPTKRSTGDDTNSHGKLSKQSSNRYKRALYLAAENAYKWDVELCAFFHKRRQAGHTYTQAICAVANAKLLPRIHCMLKAMKETQQNGNNPPQYVFRDESANPISKREARAIIVAKWGDVTYE